MKSLTLLLALLAPFAGAVEKSIKAPTLPPALIGAHVPAAAEAAAASAQAATPDAAAAQPGAASLGALAESVGVQVQAAVAPQSSDAGAAEAARNAETLLQGGQAAGAGAAALAAEPSAPSASGLSAGAPSAAGKGAPAVERSAAPAPSPVSTRAQYERIRAELNAIFKQHGILASMPQADETLTAEILREVAEHENVVTDIDDTVVIYNGVLSPRMVAAVLALRKAGKTIVFLTDRSEKQKPGSSQKTPFETLSSIPAHLREGIVVGTVGTSGGKLFRYDAKGEPVEFYEEEHLSGDVLEKIGEAAKVVTARIGEFGTEIIAANPGNYGYSMIFKAGTPEAAVKELAALFQEELRKQGLSFEVEGRMAKDPKMPPYLTFSKLNKTLMAQRVVEQLKLDRGATIFMGDSMYKPEMPKVLTPEAEAAKARAELLSGRPIPLTGNATDRNMELAAPGALTISVGSTADPRMRRAFVMSGQGEEASARVIEAMAARPHTRGWRSILPALLIIATMLGAFGFIGYVADQGVHAANQQLMQDLQDRSRNGHPF